MRRSSISRVVTFVIALLVSLSAPALALAHGLAHDHLVHEHARDAVARDHAREADHHDEHAHDDATTGSHDEGARAVEAAPLVGPADHAHAHAHETVLLVRGARDAARLDLISTAPAVPRAPSAPTALAVVVRSAALTDRALLARPGPPPGPPPSLRAPPAR